MTDWGCCESDAGFHPLDGTHPEGARLRQPERPKAHALSWDYRGQPDLDDLARILLDVSGGTTHLHKVDTDCDEYGIVIADRPLSKDEAFAEWDRQRFGGGDS